MNAQDTKRLRHLAGVLGSALKEVQGLLEKYEEPQPPQKNHKQERIDKYRYKFLSGQMTKRKAV